MTYVLIIYNVRNTLRESGCHSSGLLPTPLPLVCFVDGLIAIVVLVIRQACQLVAMSCSAVLQWYLITDL